MKRICYFIFILLFASLMSVGSSNQSIENVKSEAFLTSVKELSLDSAPLDERDLHPAISPFIPHLVFNDKKDLHIFYNPGLGYQEKHPDQKKIVHQTISEGNMVRNEVFAKSDGETLVTQSLDIDSNGNLYVLWSESYEPAAYLGGNLFFSFYNNKSWSEKTSVLDKKAILCVMHGSFIIANRDEINVFWIDDREQHFTFFVDESDYAKVFSRNIQGYKFSKAARISEKGRQRCLDLKAQEDNGNVFLTWSQIGRLKGEEYIDLFNRRRIDGSWSDIQRITYDQNYDGSPSFKSSFEICFPVDPTLIYTNDYFRDKNTKVCETKYIILKEGKWQKPRDLGIEATHIKIAGVSQKKIYLVHQYLNELYLSILDENMRGLSQQLISSSSYEKIFDCAVNKDGEIAVVWTEVKDGKGFLKLTYLKWER